MSSYVKKDKMVYADRGTHAVGIASDSSGVDVEASSDGLEVSSDYGGVSYIFVTNNEAKIGKREEYLKERDFLNLVNPSFGYRIEQDMYDVKTQLEYDGIVIQGSDILAPGLYNLEIVNKGYDSEGRVVLEVKLTTEASGKQQIIKYG
jgi:hypothetical protein